MLPCVRSLFISYSAKCYYILSRLLLSSCRWQRKLSNLSACAKSTAGYWPCHDDDEVELVPLVAKVTIGAKNSQGHHLDDHFHSEESEDAVVQYLKKHGEKNKHTQIELQQHEQEGIYFFSAERHQVLVLRFLISMESARSCGSASGGCLRRTLLSPLVSFIPAGNSSGLAWLWLCLY